MPHRNGIYPPIRQPWCPYTGGIKWAGSLSHAQNTYVNHQKPVRRQQGMGSCQGVSTAPPHPFQASAVAPHHVKPVEGVGTLKIPFIDYYWFDAPWNPEKAGPRDDKEIVGFAISLNSTDISPVPMKLFESVSHHIDTTPLPPESEDESPVSWPSSSPSGPSF